MSARDIGTLVEDTVIEMLRSDPFYAHVMLQLERVFDKPGIPTAGMAVVNMRPTLFVNGEWFRTLSDSERIAILKHEILHFLHRHWARWRNRDLGVWRVACDIAINQLIPGLPVGRLSHSDYKLPAGLSAEEYYNLIIQDSRTVARARQDMSSEDSCDSGEGARTGAKDSRGTHPWQGCDNVDEAMADGIVKDVVQTAQQALGRGNIPAEVSRIIQGLLASANDWRHITRMFVARHIKGAKESTWKRRSRRFPDMPGNRKRHVLNLLVAIDTSGSISPDQLEEFWAVITGIAKAKDVAITIAECDAKIHATYPFTPKPPAVRGYGGTDFNPVFDWAVKQNPAFDAIVYLTDGMGPAPDHEPIPTLWALSCGEAPVPWGRAVHLDPPKRARM